METLIVAKKQGMYDLRPLINYLSGVKDGTYRIEVKLVRNQRSLDQNAWLFGCIYPLLLQGLNAEGWDFTEVEHVHEFFKAMFKGNKVVNRHTGEILEIPSSTAKMDTLTFCEYCEQLRNYGREYLGVEIPDPDTNWRTMQNEK